MKTSDSKAYSLRVASLAAAVLAGYVTVLSTGPVAANVRLTQIAPENTAFWFSILAASGAATSALGFVFFGRLSNRLLRTRGTRRSMFLYSAIALAPIGWLISQADSLEMMLVLWCLMQLPAAAILSAGTAIALEILPRNLLGLASSLFGAGAVLAILFGVLIGTLTNNDPTLVLLIGSATALVLALPAAFLREVKVLPEPATEVEAKAPISSTFVYFLIATASSLAVSAMANDYFFQLASRLRGVTFAEAASLSQGLFALSAGFYLASALAIGFFARGVRSHLRAFTLSLVISALGLVLLALSQTPFALCVGASLIGIGTGINTASQFPVLRTLLINNQEFGRQAGLFNMVGVLPSIAVPALGAILVMLSKQNWPVMLGFAIAALALTSSLIAYTKISKATEA